GIYRRIIGIASDNKDARKSLEKLLITNKKWDEYVEYLEESTYELTDLEKKIEMYKKVAEIHLLRRDDPKSASDCLWRALELKFDDKDVVAKLDELALRMRDWDELEKILKIEVEHEEDQRERNRIYNRLVSLQEETLEDVEGAYDTSLKMIEEFPNDIDILRRLGRIEEATDRYKELLETLEKVCELSTDTKEKASALKKIARFSWDQFDSSEKSAETWDRYFELVEDDLEAYELYEELLEGLGRYEDLISMYKKLLGQVKLKEHHRFFLRKLGTLLSSEVVGRRGEAMDVWKKLLEGGDDAEALRTLAIWDRENENWDDLVEHLRRQLNITAGDDDKIVILKDIGEVLYEHLSKPNESISTLKEALDLNPNDLEGLAMLRSIYSDVKDFPNAADVLEKEIGMIQDAASQHNLLVQLAGWYKEEIDDKDKAISAFERILGLSASDEAAIDALEILYEETGGWEKLLRLLRTKTRDTESEPDILGFLIKGAKICEEVLGDNERSWGWYKEIFGRITMDEDVMSTIEKAAERMEQWKDLASMYEDLAPKEEEKEGQVRRWRQAATVLSEKMEDYARALNDVYQASVVDPDMVELLDEADKYALGCADWERLALIYDRISRNISDSDGRVLLLRRFAKVVWKEGENPQGAVIPLLRATEEKPEDKEIFDEFHKAALEAKEYEVLLDALDKRFKGTKDKEDRIALKLKMSRIMAEYLKDIEGAIKIIQEAVDVDPASEVFAHLILDAARSIEDNLPPNEKGYVFSWLMKTYKGHADSYDANDPFRVTFLKQVAKIYKEGLEDPASAFVTFRESHKLEPANLELLNELEELAASHGYWEPLGEHLSEVLHLSINMEVAKVIHERRAKVLEENLGRHEEAAEHYWQIIQCDPAHPFAFKKLTDFYKSVGRYNDLLMLLESEVEKRDEKVEKVLILREIAVVWEKNMGNKFEAIDVYKRILSEAPDDTEAEEALEKLQKTGLGLSLRLGGDDREEGEEEEEKVDIEELRRTLLEEDVEDMMSGDDKPTKPPKAGEKADQLPDWEDDIRTGEMPAQRVAEILSKSDRELEEEALLDTETEEDEASGLAETEELETAPEEIEDAEGVEEVMEVEDMDVHEREDFDLDDDMGEVQATAADLEAAIKAVEKDQISADKDETEEVEEVEADDDEVEEISGQPVPMIAEEDLPPEVEDTSEFDGPLEPMSKKAEEQVKAKESAYVLDEDALSEVLQEEYEVEKPGEGKRKAKKRSVKAFPPPPPKSHKKRPVVAAPPPPPRKKK
ncbi:MAG: hypothetical protein ABIJ56_16145, partial [Pseudomonadota bacterium]